MDKALCFLKIHYENNIKEDRNPGGGGGCVLPFRPDSGVQSIRGSYQMATKWPSFDNNTTAKFSLQFIIDNEQGFIFPESTTVNGEKICKRRYSFYQ